MKFDYIVGNPPYGGKVGKETDNFYSLILAKAFEKLNNQGQMITIHPTGWRILDPKAKKLTDIYYSNTTKAVLHDQMFGMFIWNVMTPVDEVMVTKNNIPKMEVSYEDLDRDGDFFENVDISQRKPIPTRYPKIMKKLLKCGRKDAIKLIDAKDTPLFIHKKYLKPKPDSTFKYPVIEKLKKKEMVLSYSQYPPKDIRSKIIIMWGSKYNLLDLEGKYQVTNGKFIFGEKEELKKLYEGLTHPIFPLMLRTFTGVWNIIIWDGYGRNLPLLEQIKMDFTDDFKRMVEEMHLKEKMFRYCVSDIKNSGKYDHYVSIAKKGATWKENVKKIISQ